MAVTVLVIVEVVACCSGDEGVGARRAGDKVGGVGRGLGGSRSSIAVVFSLR